MRAADVDITQDGKSKGQPDGGRVEHLRAGLQEELKQEAGERNPVHGGMMSKGVGIDIAEYIIKFIPSYIYHSHTKVQEAP